MTMTREEQRSIAARKYADDVYADEQTPETIEDFWAGAAWADSHPHWIPVEEELPKEKGKYMFRLSNGDMYYETYYPKLKLVANVTHWMEIHQPRKEE